MTNKFTVHATLAILIAFTGPFSFAKADSDIFEDLKVLLTTKITQETQSTPVYVDVRNLKDAHKFGRPTDIGSFTHRAVLAQTQLSKENPIYYSALITMKPDFATHTIIDYICALKIEKNLTSIDLEDCEIYYRSNFPVFSFNTDALEMRKILGKDD
ncbi:MAG: hypothetical protein CL677_09390 [Bdellovibrionaceae bacterium]|nr:hypothetical protein [Pseudobdellovibrionaceae bacterium]|tara:strand:+ start:14184 stop:14654 length:471 start_codon:yes stop_codon:yes gene_type:complete